MVISGDKTTKENPGNHDNQTKDHASSFDVHPTINSFLIVFVFGVIFRKEVKMFIYKIWKRFSCKTKHRQYPETTAMVNILHFNCHRNVSSVCVVLILSVINPLPQSGEGIIVMASVCQSVRP